LTIGKEHRTYIGTLQGVASPEGSVPQGENKTADATRDTIANFIVAQLVASAMGYISVIGPLSVNIFAHLPEYAWARRLEPGRLSVRTGSQLGCLHVIIKQQKYIQSSRVNVQNARLEWASQF
jgi:hypothetical protein